jgi:hypothetical protein
MTKAARPAPPSWSTSLGSIGNARKACGARKADNKRGTQEKSLQHF